MSLQLPLRMPTWNSRIILLCCLQKHRPEATNRFRPAGPTDPGFAADLSHSQGFDEVVGFLIVPQVTPVESHRRGFFFS
jgi:hypothetical protein